MKNLFKKTLCLLLVTVMMIVPISATDIITMHTLDAPLAAGDLGDVQPCSGCMVRIYKSGEWIEEWSLDETYLYEAYFSPKTYTPKSVETHVNGHTHTGTLYNYTDVDPGTFSGYRDHPTSTARILKVYSGATAQFYGYLTCVPNDYK